MRRSLGALVLLDMSRRLHVQPLAQQSCRVEILDGSRHMAKHAHLRRLFRRISWLGRWPCYQVLILDLAAAARRQLRAGRRREARGHETGHGLKYSRAVVE